MNPERQRCVPSGVLSSGIPRVRYEWSPIMLSSFVVPPSIAGSLCVPSLFRGTLAAGLLAFALAFAPLGTEGAVARGENANPPAAAPTAVTRFSDAALTAAAAYSEAHGGRGMLVIEGPFGGSDSAVKGAKGAKGAKERKGRH